MKILLPILSLFLLFNCVNKTERISETLGIKKIDTIMYSYKHHHGYMKLMLFSNKEFLFINQVHPELGYSKTTGTYTKESNALNLKPFLCIECKLLDRHNVYKFVCDTINFSNIEHQVKTEYFVFNWKNHNYLLSEEPDQFYDPDNDENDFNRFINDYHAKIKPENHNRYLVSETEKITNNLLPIDSFPEKYKHLILKK
jgi:hypothetical protein